MSNYGKTLTIVLIFFIVISLSGVAATLYFWQQEKVKINALQEELEDLRTRQKVTQKQLDDAKKLAEQLDGQLLERRTQIEAITAELDKEKKSKQDAVSELEQVKSSLQQREAAEQDLKSQLEKWQKTAKRLETQLKEIESEKAELENRAKEMEAAKTQNVDLDKIVVGQEATNSSTASTLPVKEKQTKGASLEGKVLVVNKEYDFVVINLGSRDGVQSRDVFSIYHKNKLIGDIKAEKIHDSMTAASFVTAGTKDKINEGDKAVFKER